MTLQQNLMNKKIELGRERDLCAELYNLWISKLHEFQDDEKKYLLYMELIKNMEPYGDMIKEEIREINRKLCELENVEAIEDTPYVLECEYKYGYYKPNIES